MDNNDPFFNKMNLPSVPEKDLIKSLITESHNDSAMKDFEFSRSNIINDIEKIDESIDDFKEVSRASQNARCYEVLAKLFDSKRMLNEQLLILQKRIREIDEANQNTSKQDEFSPINNNLFITTSDMLSLIKESSKKDNSIDNEENGKNN